MAFIVLVDDDISVLTPLTEQLESEGYKVQAFQSSIDAKEFFRKNSPDLAIFDIKMPQLNGYQLLKEVRLNNPTLPIIFLSSKIEEQDELIGFTLGADDYITKPIKPKVLLSKIKAILRRFKGNSSTSSFEVGDLVVNREEYVVTYKGLELNLPRKEFELLSLLASKPQKVFERGEILDRVWGNEVVVGGRTIDVHIRKLREKIGDNHFKTVKGVGYKYVN